MGDGTERVATRRNRHGTPQGAIMASVLIGPDMLVTDFAAAADKAAINGWPCRLRTELLPAPHMPPMLPAGYGAVYAFALAEVSSAPCGAGTVLKVGRIGARSETRFRFQHYSPRSAGSTLASSLLTYRIMWPWLGIDHLDERNVKGWMLANLVRMHIFVPDGHPGRGFPGDLRAGPDRERVRGRGIVNAGDWIALASAAAAFVAALIAVLQARSARDAASSAGRQAAAAEEQVSLSRRQLEADMRPGTRQRDRRSLSKAQSVSTPASTMRWPR